MLIDFVLFWLAFLLMIPIISGYYAYTHGRSFWLWFFIGCILPVFSYFILLLLPDKKDKYEEELHQLRVDLGILGVKPEASYSDSPLKKLLKKKSKNILFKLKKDANSQYFLDFFIDNKNILDYLNLEEKKDKTIIKKEYISVPLSVIKFPSYHLLGHPESDFSDKDERSILFNGIDFHSKIVDSSSFISVKIEVLPTCIIWRDFRKNNVPIVLKDEKSNGFVFNKVQYIDALQEISKEFHL
jgi:hypothetical protein